MGDPTMPFTGFGTRPGGTWVAFGIERDDASNALPEWNAPLAVVTRHVPGGDRNVTQLLGKGPSTVTYRVWLDAVADYQTLVSLVGTTATLTTVQNTTGAPGSGHYELGVAYWDVANVTLIGLANVLVYANGITECDASFLRSNP